MLVLTLDRKDCPGVTITLPDGREQRLELVEIRAEKVRLGFSFDKDILILRDDAKVREPKAVPQ